jgi:hypothetical protein
VSHPTEAALGAAFVTLLDATLDGGAGYGEKPASGAGQVGTTFLAYAVVYPGSTALREGTAADPNADADQTVQVTYVGKTAQQADTARDLARAAVLASGAIAVTGRTVWPVELTDSTVVRRDDTVQPPLWYAVDRYTTHTTPA